MANELTQVGQVSVNTEVLKLTVQDATVTVRHEQREDIAVQTNNPSHWQVGSGTVNQSDVRQTYGDVQIFIEVNGVNLVQLIARLWRWLFAGVPTTSAEVKVETPTQTAAAEDDYGPDELLVLVPLNYAGGLDLTVEGEGECHVDSWTGSSARINYSSSSDLKIGAVTVVGAFAITYASAAEVQLGDITGDTVTVDLEGDEDFKAGTITAGERLVFTRAGDGESSLTALMGKIVEVKLTGDGDQELGDIKADTVKIDHDESNCDVTVKKVQSTSFSLNHSSDGSVDIERLDTTAVHLDCDGAGDVTIRAGSAQSGRVYNGGALDVSITGRFGYISQKNDGDGSLEVEVTE